jgi:hypothetical protein
MIVRRILEARKVYAAQGLPPPTLIVSEKALDEIQREFDCHTCALTPDGDVKFLGMRVILDINRLAGWELREDFGNR